LRLRVKFKKTNYLRYIGHLDLMRLFQRTLNLAEIPVKYSKGYNPLPRMSIATPLSLGIEGEEEYMEIDLVEEIDVSVFIDSMNKILPKDVQILDAIYSYGKESLAFMINHALYEISFENIGGLTYEDMEKVLDKWLNKDEILIKRLRKRGRRKIEVEENIIPLIKGVKLVEARDMISFEAILRVGEFGNLRVFDFMDAFLRDNDLEELDKDAVLYKRKALFIDGKNGLEKPF